MPLVAFGSRATALWPLRTSSCYATRATGLPVSTAVNQQAERLPLLKNHTPTTTPIAAPTADPTPGSPKMAPTPAPPPAPTAIAGPTPYISHPRDVADAPLSGPSPVALPESASDDSFMARLPSYGTILEMGISTMSVAPRSRRAGIRMLISRRGTTVSTA
ncbi:MAG: hypothetical protein F4017_07710 [Acidimicrobiaceae bacterium]|nr:hypothetical protein [Acidimicrobiaceae bacterium]MYK74459.1 hypothetical protein [Acidimicrobiaceae bacterium]